MPVKVDLLDRFTSRQWNDSVAGARRDVSAIKNPDGNLRMDEREPPTDQRLRQHLSGGSARGVANSMNRESTNRLALLDFDSHRAKPNGRYDMLHPKLSTHRPRRVTLESHSVASGGRGIHVY